MDSRSVCLVTGAAKRIGRAIALDLARHGHDVAVHYRNSRSDALATVAEVAAQGGRADAFQADLSEEAACAGLIDRVVSCFGRVDVVVNNASTFDADAAASFSHEAMERHWRANTAPAIILARALHEHLARRGAKGCVVNLLDQKLWNLNPDYFSYTLSKAALHAATVMLAQTCAPTLRVCGVAPGVTLTPLQLSSTPQDVARAVRFLIESPAITGISLIVDGGQHLNPQPRDVLYLTRDANAQTP
jgi:NAD(P)-dependent dehydrogenase (short-subunit alcohol dehydrogenase family)